ncbi:hypothetical protein EC912_108144 [Luteibacter rhizovicinus]|uniref:DUF535 domain-containing protein n=1 Tax=Luteibacter rhizovicinus TaxID=242606 RepID=A0A4R3YIX7_9GAMM|nr:DUF535 family protein [Luteibacter rhizovicinus]TCV92150.1 hypothetical protein EC912_108144 [Luteibacter rhizovicinus]
MSSLSRFIRSLRGRSQWHSTRLRGAEAAVKYAARCLRAWKPHGRWLAFLDETPGMAGVVAVDPTLVERYQHRFISRSLRTRRRLAILSDHYAFAAQHFPRELFDAIYLRRTVDIGAIALRDGGALRIVLKAPALRGREGELSIYLFDENGLQLSFATVTIADDGSTLLIGCIQGAAAGAGREVIRDLTKQCHGLRPKNLLLSLIYALAEGFGIKRIRAVGNAVHPFAGIANKIKADYDGFWSENDGILSDDGLFDLPPSEPVRSELDVESKHRSAFRKREALRRQACTVVAMAFQHAVRDISMAA